MTNTPLTFRDYLAGIPANAKPYIPELHQDGCEDDTCVRCNPLSPEREQEIRETHPGEWYAGAWTQDYIESIDNEPAYNVVRHQESGTVLAMLPDFAGPIALFIADAHDAVPELLAEVDRLRGALADQAKRRGDELAELRNERAALLKRLAETENEPRWQDAEWDAKRRCWNLDTEGGAR